MTAIIEPHVGVRVDVTNPGQFFGCCGLLELADRLWHGAEGWFEDSVFAIHALDAARSGDTSLTRLMSAITEAGLVQVDAEDDASSPLHLPKPFDLRLDWWKDNRAGGSELKVWAGSMGNVRIARAMQIVLRQSTFQNEWMFARPMVVYDPSAPTKKVEPFYFDARRGSSAHPLDVGFSTDPLQMTTAAYPAVELLCLVGLQRCRPVRTKMRRIFDYYTWGIPLDARLAASAVCGLLPGTRFRAFRFETAFRTSQRKHKAFTNATQFQGANDDETESI
jgi:hypothetical protein